MAEPLGEYRRKRNFANTPEPGASTPTPGSSAGPTRFVVQEHHARSMHWDLRLERDGVLVSWAVPKGLPPDGQRNHLAVQTEDHPMQYLDFEGEIPPGEYGGGSMSVWDFGTYEAEKFNDREVKFTLHGERGRAVGRHVMFHTDGNQWMIRRLDPPLDPSRQRPPEIILPMLASKGAAPRSSKAWAFELRWPGLRTLVHSYGGRVRLMSSVLPGDANNNADAATSEPVFSDTTSHFPELRALGRALGSTEAVLDGVIVTLDDGRPTSKGLHERLAATSAAARDRAARRHPACVMLFDLLWLDGHAWLDRSWQARREQLEALRLAGAAWQTPAVAHGDGQALRALAEQLSLDGIVAKKLTSTYDPGVTSPHWIEIDR